PTAAYTDNNNSADQVSGSAEANASISITETAPNAATFGTSASAGGTYSSLVATVNGKVNAKITATYVVTATDAAGNTSAACTVRPSGCRGTSSPSGCSPSPSATRSSTSTTRSGIGNHRFRRRPTSSIWPATRSSRPGWRC